MQRLLKFFIFAFILTACGQGRLSPQGGTVTSVQGGNGLTGGGTGGAITLNIVGAAGGGLSVLADSVGLSTACGNGEVLQWDGDSWECGVGGITNSAGVNVLMKSDGTNAVASSWTDDGTTSTTTGAVTVTGSLRGNTELVLGASAQNYFYTSLAGSAGNQDLNLYAAGTGVVRINGNVGGLANAGTGGLIIYPGANSSTPAHTLASNGDATHTGNLSTNGNLTSGDAAGDVFDHNGDLAKFGSSDGATYIAGSAINAGYNLNSVGAVAFNYAGYQGGSTQFRNTEFYDGKSALACSITGSTKTLNCVGGIQVNGTSVSTATITGAANTVLKSDGAGNAVATTITDGGTGTVSTASHVYAGLDTGTGSKIFNVGRDTSLSTDVQNGYRVTAFSDGNVYFDHKTHTGGTVTKRFGAGASGGAANTWMTLNTSSGLTTFPFAVTTNGNLTAGDSTSDTHTVNGLTTINAATGGNALNVTHGTTDVPATIWLTNSAVNNGAASGIIKFGPTTSTAWAQIRGISLTAFPGTTDGGLVFETRDAGVVAERMRIKDNGEVLIGAPNTTTGQLVLSGTEAADQKRFVFDASDGSDRFFVETDLDATSTNDLLGFRSASTDNVLVLKGDGKVGFSTSTPGGRFAFASADSGTAFAAGNWGTGGWTLFGPNSGTSQGASSGALGVGYSTTSDEAQITSVAPSSGWKRTVFAAQEWAFRPQASTGDQIVIDVSGRMGIADSSPDNKLTVTGAISATTGFFTNEARTVGLLEISSGLHVRTNTTDSRAVFESDGDVCIGTASCSTKLTVAAGTTTALTSRAGTVLELEQANGTENNLTIRGTSPKSIAFANASSNIDGRITYDQISRGMVFVAAANSRLAIDNVGTFHMGDTAIGTVVNNNVDVLTLGNTGTGHTTSGIALIKGSTTHSFDTTAANKLSYGASFTGNVARSAGTNFVTHTQLFASTESGTGVEGYALATDKGWVWLNVDPAAGTIVGGDISQNADKTIFTEKISAWGSGQQMEQGGGGSPDWPGGGTYTYGTGTGNLTLSTVTAARTIFLSPGGAGFVNIGNSADDTINITGTVGATTFGTSLTVTGAFSATAGGAVTVTNSLGVTNTLLATSGDLFVASKAAAIIFHVGEVVDVGAGGVAGGATIMSGSDDPNGVVAAGMGSLWLRTDGTLHTKVAGTGNTGWAPLANNSYKGTHLEWTEEWLFAQTANTNNYAISNIWGCRINGSNTLCTTIDQTAESGRPGVQRASTGTTATGYATITTSTGAYAFGEGDYRFDDVVRWVSLSDGTNGFGSRVGFGDTATALLQTNGCGFLYDERNVSGVNGANANKLIAYCCSAGTCTYDLLDGSNACDEAFTSVDTPVVANTWMDLSVRMTGTTRAEFFNDDTKVCSITTNIPTARVGAGHSIVKSVGTAGRFMEFDFTRILVDLTTARSP